MTRQSLERSRPPAQPPSVAGRVPPHDLDAEAAVLSAVLTEKQGFDRVADVLKPEHFYSDANRRIFEAAVELAREGAPIDIVTVAAWLRSRKRLGHIGGSSYLAQLAFATPAVAHLEKHALFVVEHYLVRRTIAEAQMIAAEGYGPLGDVRSWLDAAEQRMYAIARHEHRDMTERLGPVLGRVFDQVISAAQRGQRMSGVPTGYGRVDAMTAGMHAGDLWVVAARPGMGKTALALSIAKNVTDIRPDALTDYGAVVISLEMPREQLASRQICAEARVDLNRFRQGMLGSDDWQRLSRAGADLSPRPVWIEDGAGLTVLEMRAKVRRIKATWERDAQWEERKGPDGEPVPVLAERERRIGLVVVDYLQLAKGREGVPREQEIAEISRSLKQLAKDLRVPVVALSQLNRAVEARADKRPMLSDLRESGAIEQDADTIVFIYRDEYYNPDSTRHRGIAELILAKQRNGPTGRIFVRYTAHCTRFDNLAPGEIAEEVADA